MLGGGDFFNARVRTSTVMSQSTVDKSELELELKTKKVSEKLSESVNMITNEPSLAFYRIQEHVRKSLPLLVDQKHEMQDLQSRVQGACFDTEYAITTVNSMSRSATHLQNVQDLLKNAMFMKQQIEYDESKRYHGPLPPPQQPPQISQGGGPPLVTHHPTSITHHPTSITHHPTSINQ